MTTQPASVQCACCKRPLPAPQAICPHCDAQLSGAHTFMDGHYLPGESGGAYLCPWCDQHFATPLYELPPPGARWWQPTGLCPQCPHCHGFLRDTCPRVRLRPSRVLAACLAVACAHLAGGLTAWLTVPVLLLTLAAFHWPWQRQSMQHEAQHSHPRRFERLPHTSQNNYKT